MDELQYLQAARMSRMQKGDQEWIEEGFLWELADAELPIHQFQVVHWGSKEDFKCGDEFMVVEMTHDENPLTIEMLNNTVDEFAGWTAHDEEKATFCSIVATEWDLTEEDDAWGWDFTVEDAYDGMRNALKAIEIEAVLATIGVDYKSFNEAHTIFADDNQEVVDGISLYECKYTLTQAGITSSRTLGWFACAYETHPSEKEIELVPKGTRRRGRRSRRRPQSV